MTVLHRPGRADSCVDLRGRGCGQDPRLSRRCKPQPPHAGFSVDAYRRIGVLEVAGAAGVLLGLDRCRCLVASPASGCCSCSPAPSSRTCATRRPAAPGRAGSRLRPARRRLPRRPDRSVVMSTPVPVVIVGAGPTGLTAATLLGQYGVECLVLDRWESVYPQPRAVHLDDEVYRILARIGVREEFAAISRPCHGLRLLEPRHAGAGRVPPRHRHRPARLPRRRTCSTSPSWRPSCAPTSRATPSVTLRGNVEVTASTQDGAGPVRVEVTDRATGAGRSLLAEYVLGCDGANSLARAAIGAAMQRPAVRAALARRRRRHRRRPRASGRACTRSATRPGPVPTCGSAPTRYRWEFRLARRRDRRRLPRPHPAAPADLRRGPATSRSTGCSSCGWPSTPSAPSSPTGGGTGGSSCSATPPTSPRRSSARACAPGCATPPTWPGSSPACSPATSRDRLLDTYQAERKPHARAMIRLAKLVGTAMTDGGELGNLLRRLVAPRLHLRPRRQPDHVLNSETPPLHRAELVHPAPPAPLTGRPALPERAARRRPPLRRRRRRPVRPRHDRRPGTPPSGPKSPGAAASSSRPPWRPLHRWLRRGHATSASSAPTARCYAPVATCRRFAPACRPSPQTTGPSPPG